jgi:hypothetical protein
MFAPDAVEGPAVAFRDSLSNFRLGTLPGGIFSPDKEDISGEGAAGCRADASKFASIREGETPRKILDSCAL